MYGEQWVCKCGTHNFFGRIYCRSCHGREDETSVKNESALEVMDNYIKLTSGKKVSGADNQQGRR
jgi:hypothetical protein